MALSRGVQVGVAHPENSDFLHVPPAIAEENQVKMPSFLWYMAWSVGILIPTFILLTVDLFQIVVSSEGEEVRWPTTAEMEGTVRKGKTEPKPLYQTETTDEYLQFP
jgi:hypothetical protein